MPEWRATLLHRSTGKLSQLIFTPTISLKTAGPAANKFFEGPNLAAWTSPVVNNPMGTVMSLSCREEGWRVWEIGRNGFARQIIVDAGYLGRVLSGARSPSEAFLEKLRAIAK
jgi:hypothetical protein